MTRRARAAALLLTTLVAAPPALAQAMRCERGTDVRTVQVVYADPGQPVPCEVLYGKQAAGTLETLWRADHEAGYCEARASDFVDRLEELGFRCSEADETPAESAAPG